MKYPTEFIHRVYKTRLSGFSKDFKKMDKIRSENPEAEIDVIYENGKSVVVIVFPTQEDCLAFTLKYGEYYV